MQQTRTEIAGSRTPSRPSTAFRGVARKARGLSDRAIAWLFVTPTILLLLAINIYPLIWTVYLSFTNYRANRPNRVVEWVGGANYERILTDPDVWANLQRTAHFVGFTMLFQVILGFGLALLLHRSFRGHGVWTTVILLPMMLSPAVVGMYWKYLFDPQLGIFTYIINSVWDFGPFSMTSNVELAPWAIVIVDTWMWTPYIMLLCLAGLRSVPNYLYEAAEIDRASSWRKFWNITLPMVLPFLMLAVMFRAIENFKMFDLVFELTSGGPGNITRLASIDLKELAFDRWQTGRASALAIVLFVTVFGAMNVYVKLLNRVKSR